MKSRHSSGLTSVPVAIMSTVTATARVVVVAELREDRLRVFLDLVGDLLAELVALGELLAHSLDDVVGMAVGLGEHKRLRDFTAAGEYLGSLWRNVRTTVRI